MAQLLHYLPTVPSIKCPMVSKHSVCSCLNCPTSCGSGACRSGYTFSRYHLKGLQCSFSFSAKRSSMLKKKDRKELSRKQSSHSSYTALTFQRVYFWPVAPHCNSAACSHPSRPLRHVAYSVRRRCHCRPGRCTDDVYGRHDPLDYRV